MLEITYHNKDFPPDTEFDLGGLLVLNGKSTKMDEDQEAAFVARHHKAVKEYFENSELVKVTGSPKFGPSEVSKMYTEPEAVIVPSPYLSEKEAEELIEDGGDDN